MEQAGTPLSLYDDPQNLFVAGFIGSPRMNFLRAEIDGDGHVRLPDHGDIVVPLTLSAAPSADAKLLLGIRPEHFGPELPVRLNVTVDLVEHLGGASYAYARTSSAHSLTIEMRDARTVGRGNVLETSFDPARAFLFDANTGGRLR